MSAEKKVSVRIEWARLDVVEELKITGEGSPSDLIELVQMLLRKLGFDVTNPTAKATPPSTPEEDSDRGED